MTRTQITVTDLARSGVTPIAQIIADATAKHYFAGNTGAEYLEVENVGGSATVTVLHGPSVSADDLSINDLSVGCLGGTTLIGPFRKNTFNQNASGHVYIDPSTSTTLRFRAYRLTRTP